MNKKGAEMTIGTIIAITLGVALLVFLIFGFSRGWDNLWSTVTEIGGTDSNVGDVERGCEVACASNNNYDYCTKIRILNFGNDAEGNKIPGATGSCQKLSDDGNISVSCGICA